MAHCYICDYSDSVTSDYYSALEAVDPNGNTVVFDDKINQYVCTDCIGASLANYRAILANSTVPPKLQSGELPHEVELTDDGQSVPWDDFELEDSEGQTLYPPD